MEHTNCTTKKKKIIPREIAHDSGLTAQQEINLVMVEIVNRTKTEVEDCSIRLQDLTDRFLFILNLSSIYIEHEQEKEKLRKECLGFANYHDKDVTANQLYHDIIDFFMFLQARGNAAPSNLTHALECFMQLGRDVFPTLCIACTVGYCSPSNFQYKLRDVIFKVEIYKNMSKIIYATGTPNKLGFNQHPKRIPFSRCEK